MIDRLECLTVEMSKPHSRPFLLSTWYRLPNSRSSCLFNDFENLFGNSEST